MIEQLHVDEFENKKWILFLKIWITKLDPRKTRKFELTNNNCIINQTSPPSKDMSFAGRFYWSFKELLQIIETGRLIFEASILLILTKQGQLKKRKL